MIDELIIDYLNLKYQKIVFAKTQNWQLAAETRDKEREMSKQISNILIPDSEFVNWSTCDKIIDSYCKQNYNCSAYKSLLCIKSIQRIKKLNNLGI